MFFLPGHLYVRNIFKNENGQKFSILILSSSKKTNTDNIDISYYVKYIKVYSDGRVELLSGTVIARYDNLEYSPLYTQIKKQKC